MYLGWTAYKCQLGWWVQEKSGNHDLKDSNLSSFIRLSHFRADLVDVVYTLYDVEFKSALVLW